MYSFLTFGKYFLNCLPFVVGLVLWVSVTESLSGGLLISIQKSIQKWQVQYGTTDWLKLSITETLENNTVTHAATPEDVNG